MFVLSCIIILIEITMFLILGLVVVITESNDKFWLKISLVFGIVFFGCLGIILNSRYEKSEEGIRDEYNRKVEDVVEAEKELQKFLIDHPEFKE